ncbi:PPK2 family polyphosphate kinase [Lacisediminihabitans changchengi]|uniref:Polyphosphate kinase 2 family protein n=1 Tax=Lacisediminihabitans changchengi TaxID=2787634 RepID=A0A934W3I7_9MICO|nr:PPK2 family polyphosphate kinase [Lacisediminihabitans changchengi]MBK4349023.1 polyphosphate kinase 2 family protein [Lacisediminihabitans changchengi]
MSKADSAKNTATGWSADVRELLRVGPGFDLTAVDPDSAPGFELGKRGGTAEGAEELARNAQELNDLQERLFANSRYGGTRSLLLIVQAMDTAGKGGIVEHVVGEISPEGLSVYAFKKPTPEELEHDFLWRVRRRTPAAGMVGVFDRSHYEDVLIGRVRALAPAEQIEQRYGQILEFERELVAAGTTIVKVMLHISADEQKKRLADRLDRPDKVWKYNPSDVDERALWPQYQQAYQLALERTSTTDAPWFVVPANHKWYARIAVQQLLLGALRGLDLQWPAVDFDVGAEKTRLATSNPAG